MNKMFHSYGPHRGPIPGRRNGVLIANGTGETVAYALWYMEESSTRFVDPGTPVYEGMIIGEHSHGTDHEVNPKTAKQHTTMRASGQADTARLHPPRQTRT